MNTPQDILELFSVVDVGYVLTQPNGTILQVNQTSTRLFNQSRASLLSKSIFHLIASKQQDLQRAVSRLHSRDSQGEWEVLLRRAKGAPFPALVQVVAGYSPDDHAKHLHWLIRDLSEQHLLQKAKERAEFLAAASDQLNVDFDLPATLERITRLAVPSFADVCYIHVRDREGKLLQFSVAHIDPVKESELMEQERQHLLTSQNGIRPPKWLPTHKRNFSMRVTDELLRDLAYADEHLRVLRQMGLVSFMSVPLKAHGQTYGAIAFGRSQSAQTYDRDDLTQAEDFARRAAVAIENALRFEQAQKRILQREQALLGALHEVKLPVSVILNAVRLMEPLVQEQETRPGANRETENVARSNVLRTQLEEITRSTARIMGVVNNLSELIRLQSEQMPPAREWINLSHLVSVVLNNMSLLQKDGRYRKNIRLELNLPPTPQIHLYADEQQIRKVLVNLLDNALKYSMRGLVQVELLIEPAAQDPQRSQAHLIIRDEGIGVPTAEQERIFEPFVRASNAAARNIAGLGLGLALSREIIAHYHGRIWVESAGVDQGSAFHVVLPEIELEYE